MNIPKPVPCAVVAIAGQLAADSELGPLTPPQREAVRLLAVGSSVAGAAQALGLSRMTLYRWMKEDAAFRAAYNAWQREMITSVRSRLLQLTEDAFNTVATAVRGGDRRCSLAVLNAHGLLSPATPGVDEVETLRRLMDLERRERDVTGQLREARIQELEIEARAGKVSDK